MRKYFIVLGYQRKGPFALEELKGQNVDKNTLIWFFELGDAKPAGEIEEISSIFSDSTIIKDKTNDAKQDNSQKKTLSDEELLKIYEESQKNKKEEKKEPEVVEPEDKKQKDNEEKEQKIAEIVESVKQDKKEQEKQQKKEVEFHESNEFVIPISNAPQPIEEPEKTFTTTPSIERLSQKKYEKKYENTEYSSNSFSKNPYVGDAPPKPQNYILASILTTIFCCMPLGIISIIFAAQVDGKYREGDYTGAEKAANTAKTLVIASVVTGIIFFIIMFIGGVA